MNYGSLKALDNFLGSYIDTIQERKQWQQSLLIKKEQEQREQARLALEQKRVNASIEHNKLIAEQKAETQKQTSILNAMSMFDRKLKIQEKAQELLEKENFKKYGSTALGEIADAIDSARGDTAKAALLGTQVAADMAGKYGINVDELSSLVDPILESLPKPATAKTHQVQRKNEKGQEVVSFVTDSGKIVGEFSTGEMSASVVKATEDFLNEERAIRKDIISAISAGGSFYSKSSGGVINIGEISTLPQEEREEQIWELVREINRQVEEKRGNTIERANRYFQRLIPDEEARNNWIRGLNLQQEIKGDIDRGISFDTQRDKFWDKKLTEAGLFIPEKKTYYNEWIEARERIKELPNAEDRAIAMTVLNRRAKKFGVEPEEYDEPWFTWPKLSKNTLAFPMATVGGLAGDYYRMYDAFKRR